MQRLLQQVAFRDAARARDYIDRLGNGIPERIQARMQKLLAAVPDPDKALHFLERFRLEHRAAFDRVISSPLSLQYLITIFSYSIFLGEAVLQYPEWLLQTASSGSMHRVLSCEEYENLLKNFLGQSSGIPSALD